MARDHGRAFAMRDGDDAITVDLPDEPPTFTPEAAWALLQILIKAHDRLTGTANPKGAAQ